MRPIYCKHKMIMPVLNRSFVGQFCMLHSKPCNSTICSRCDDLHEIDVIEVETDFIRRSEKEIERVRETCNACPFFNKKGQICDKMEDDKQFYTVDQLAEFPGNHCPEGMW